LHPTEWESGGEHEEQEEALSRRLMSYGMAVSGWLSKEEPQVLVDVVASSESGAFAVWSNAALEALSDRMRIDLLHQRMHSLESRVADLSRQVSEIVSKGQETRAIDERFTEELMDLLSGQSGLPERGIPDGYTVEDPLKE